MILKVLSTIILVGYLLLFGVGLINELKAPKREGDLVMGFCLFTCLSMILVIITIWGA